MRKIVFVDDQQEILGALRRLLRHYHRTWDMVFVDSGEAALAELRRAPADIIVSDMKMPGMDGLELLTRVQESYPDTVRFVLSGQTEYENVLNVAPIVTRFLHKPLNSILLKNTLESTCHLLDHVDRPVIREIFREAFETMPQPGIYSQLVQSLRKLDFCPQEFSAIINHSPDIRDGVIQTVNSGIFEIYSRVNSVEEALKVLGTGYVKYIVLLLEVIEIFKQLPEAEDVYQISRQHFLETAAYARQSVCDESQQLHAFVAGSLHDIGFLVLASARPEKSLELAGAVRETGRPLHEVEKEFFGVTHAEVGASLLKLWGLPLEILEAVAYHHEPDKFQGSDDRILKAVVAANNIKNLRR